MIEKEARNCRGKIINRNSEGFKLQARYVLISGLEEARYSPNSVWTIKFSIFILLEFCFVCFIYVLLPFTLFSPHIYNPVNIGRSGELVTPGDCSSLNKCSVFSQKQNFSPVTVIFQIHDILYQQVLSLLVFSDSLRDHGIAEITGHTGGTLRDPKVKGQRWFRQQLEENK